MSVDILYQKKKNTKRKFFNQKENITLKLGSAQRSEKALETITDRATRAPPSSLLPRCQAHREWPMAGRGAETQVHCAQR